MSQVSFSNFSEQSKTNSLVKKSLACVLAVVAVIATVALFSASPSKNPTALIDLPIEEETFQAWMQKHAKVYETDEEYLLRFQTFIDNVALIRIHNQQGYGFELEVNRFADMTTSEFTALMSRPFDTNKPHGNQVWLEEESLPKAVNWRQKQAVTSVKDQGPCGSSWSFSTTGAIEGMTAIKTGKLLALSEQQLIDCSDNQGCNGGSMEDAFTYLKAAGGLELERAYPYRAQDDGVCKANYENYATSITGYASVPPNNSIQLQAAVAQQPVSVAIQASQYALQFYSSGVITGECGTNLDHGVLIVGYGTTNEGQQYWIVKNSWGKSWGNEGYVWIARSSEVEDPGVCGVAMRASYPTF